MFKRITMLWGIVRHDLRLLWYAMRTPGSPRWLKFGAVGLALYLVLPIDLIPDFIPVVGVVDDLVLVPLALRWLLSRLPANIRAAAERRAGGQSPRAEVVDVR